MLKPINDIFSLYEIARPKTAPDVPGFSDKRYTAKLVETADELEAVLRQRFDVFGRELSAAPAHDAPQGLDYDEFDLRCEHIIV